MDELQQYVTDQLPAEIVGQLIAYYHLLLGYETTGERRFFDPFRHGSAKQHFLIVKHGVVISHADVSQREISHRGERYRVGGVGEVMTCPTFQGEGYGKRVVAAATDYIRRSDADLGMLFTGREIAPFYQQNGWIALNDPGVTYGDPPQFSDEFVMVLPITEHAIQHHADFEHGPIFVGSSMW